jgi:hypothetical protein
MRKQKMQWSKFARALSLDSIEGRQGQESRGEQREQGAKI